MISQLKGKRAKEEAPHRLISLATAKITQSPRRNHLLRCDSRIVHFINQALKFAGASLEVDRDTAMLLDGELARRAGRAPVRRAQPSAVLPQVTRSVKFQFRVQDDSVLAAGDFLVTCRAACRVRRPTSAAR